LVTPYLDEGTILPGVMRDSILVNSSFSSFSSFNLSKSLFPFSLLIFFQTKTKELTREWNEFKVTERRITIDEVTKAVNEGRVRRTNTKKFSKLFTKTIHCNCS